MPWVTPLRRVLVNKAPRWGQISRVGEGTELLEIQDFRAMFHGGVRKAVIPLTNSKSIVIQLPGDTMEFYLSEGASNHYLGTATWRSAWNGLRALFVVRGGPLKG